MKSRAERKYNRLFCVLLALVLLLFQFVGNDAGEIALVMAVNSSYRQEIGNTYEPFTEGYYGYFPVRYWDGGKLDMTALPALVKDGHTLFDISNTCGLLGILGDENEKGYHITAWERDIYFLRDSALVYITFGETNLEYTMPVSTVYQDRVLWVPAEWLFWLTGGTFFPLSDGYVAIAAPEKNVLDVLVEIDQDAAFFDYASAFGMSSKEFDMWGDFFAGLDTFDGVMTLELDKWMSALPNHVPMNAWGIKDSKNYVRISDGTYAGEVMDLILQSSPDEAEYIQDALTELSEYILETVLEEAKETNLSFERLAEQAEIYLAKLAAEVSAEGKYEFAQRLGKYGNNRLNQGTVAAWKADCFEFAGWGVEAFAMAADLIEYYGTYESRDEKALSAARDVMDQLDSRTKFRFETAVPEQSMRKMEQKLAAYESGQETFAVTQWFQEHFATYIAEAVTGEMAIGAIPLEAIFVGYKLASRLNPDYMAEIEAAEAFEESLVAILYQQDIYPICSNQISKFLGRSQQPSRLMFLQSQNKGLSEEGLDQALALAYYYLKSSYVARSLATTAAEYIYGKEKCIQQEDILRAEVEQMGILASCCKEDLPLPSVWAEKAEGYSDEYLQGIVTPAYLHLKGNFVDAETNEPVEEVEVEVLDQDGQKMGEFKSETDGSFDIYLPLSWDMASAATIQNCILERTATGFGEEGFLPWKSPYNKMFAYPSLERKNSSVTLICNHKDYPEQKEKHTKLIMARPDGKEFPTWELLLETGPIPLGLDYYRYLKEVHIPEVGIASREEMEVGSRMNMQNMADLIKPNGGLGFLSADVRDYDGDGIKEMLVLDVVGTALKNTDFGKVYSNGSEKTCLALELLLYGIVDGKIQKLDSAYITEMDWNSWGPMVFGVQKQEGVFYLYGYSAMEDNITDGSRPFSVYHVEDKKLVMDLMAGRIGWGQGQYTGDANVALGTRNLEILNTPLEYVKNTLNGFASNPDSVLEKLEGSIFSYIRMKASGDRIWYQASDCTYILEILEKGEAAVKPQMPDIPEEYAEPDGVAEIEVAAENLIASIVKASGISLEKAARNVSENSCSLTYEAVNGSSISLDYTTADKKLTTLRVMLYGGVNAEWITLKDTCLSLLEFGLTGEEFSAYLGDCGFNLGSSERDGLSVYVVDVGTSILMMQWK